MGHRRLSHRLPYRLVSIVEPLDLEYMDHTSGLESNIQGGKIIHTQEKVR